MNHSTLKFACHIFIVFFIYALLLLFSTLRIYYSFSSSFKRRKRKLCCLFPIRKKNTTKGCTFTKCDGGSSVLDRNSGKTKLKQVDAIVHDSTMRMYCLLYFMMYIMQCTIQHEQQQ